MNGSWHDDLENAATIDEAVAFVRNYLGTLPAHELPRYCQPARIDFFVHASLRISQINRKAATGLFFFPARRAGQMG
jgi:hypothetical protein